ncbi:Glycosyltransferase [Quillaja saponaria]|uniref:Glycosyltransferase n=1 Tax=Quillaja saponaria TaxID=32244 RepID=A0AAD7LFV9_QUISA|nr:Glycosyltransferase [Quillaja saponaria]
MKETVVLHPASGCHQIVSMVELAKLIVLHQPSFSIIILIPTLPSNTNPIFSYINEISQTNLPISFFSLPRLPFPYSNQDSNKTQYRASNIFESIRLSSSHVLDALQKISITSTILALVTSTVLLNFDTHIPIYHYFTSCASAVALFLYLPTIHNQITKSFKDLGNTLLHFPGLPPICASYMPQPVLNRDDPGYHYFLDFADCLSKSKGVIVNTFDLLEQRATKVIVDGACLPNQATPPIFCIGPLISSVKDYAGASFDEPSNSSVWRLLFGLERSNQKFLWVLKNPINVGTEPNLEELLPEGFLERAKEKGVVVKSWAPQNAILSHKSVGGFVTHCGWNSVLEAVSYGVPMVAWPLYAEQHMNSVVLVEEMKLAIPISNAITLVDSKEGEKGLVGAEEVKKRVKQLMELEDGKILRQRSLEMKVMAKAVWSSGGSSSTAFSQLLGSWMHE